MEQALLSLLAQPFENRGLEAGEVEKWRFFFVILLTIYLWRKKNSETL
ncbi:unnamed protein product [Brassica rapa subsp. trilocularis]